MGSQARHEVAPSTFGARLLGALTAALAVGLVCLVMAPRAFADATPPDPGNVNGPELVPLPGEPVFTFDDTVGGDVDHFRCTLQKLNPAGTVVVSETETDPCTSPQTITELDEGLYRFLVRAVDADGNESQAAGVGFRAYTGGVPAGTDFVLHAPADGSAQQGSLAGFSGTMDTNHMTGISDFLFRRYVPIVYVNVARLDRDGSTVTVANFEEEITRLCVGCEDFDWTDETPFWPIWKVTKSGSLPSAEGRYRLSARQPGSASSGLPDISDVRTFTIDRTAPDTSILSGPPPSSNTSPTFTFDGTDPDPENGFGSGVDRFECSINGGPWEDCDSGSPFGVTAPEGRNTFEVRAIDLAGNVDPTPASSTFIVDLTPPEITITKSLNKDRYLLHEGPAPVFHCVDPLVGVPPATPAASGVKSCTATPINDEDLGPHLFTVNAEDHAGNTSAKSVAYTIDPPDYGKIVKQSNPLAYYRFDEQLGSSEMVDSSGNGHHGTYQNGIALRRDGATACERRPHPPRACELANPAENKAAYFPARDGHGYVNGITAPTTAYTMEAWVNPRDGADMMVMSHGGGGQLFIKDGKLAFRQVQDTIPSDAAVQPGAWTHVAATWDGHNTRLYVNGVQVAHSTAANKPPSGTSTFYVGYGEMAPWFHGELDEAAYYGSAVSAHRIFDRWKVGAAKDNASLEGGNSDLNTEGPFTDPQAPKNGGLYAPTKTPDADFECSDVDDVPGDSDIAGCTATVDGDPIANGDPLPDSLGTHTFTVTAVDEGGNEYVHHHAYTVKTFKDLFNADAPVLYCRLGELSGGALVDSSGNGRHGEYKNDQESGPVGISGDGDRARNFFGAGGYGYVNDVSAPRFQSTLEAWVNPADARDQSIVGHGDAGEIYIEDGSFKFRRMGETVTSSVPVQVGQWQQVAATWDGADIRIYVNGVETGKAESTRRPSSVSTFYVGFGELAPWFRGAIDEVAYYPVALNANRMYQHWLADPPPEDLTPGTATKPKADPAEAPVQPATEQPAEQPATAGPSQTQPVTGTVGGAATKGSKASRGNAKSKAKKRRARVKRCKKIGKKSKRKACLKRARTL